ncbi:MAG: Metal dependent phosphohydrolase [Candidatus Nomurabacteria bacterium GW2011_GWB1_37_5]|uniref:5'-deoxynucleotidase n=1 Tax=Candidatus Nomurabacteria bacterium GW2011_GWB1_37_5 TaxID=1618742 RepID=A0A0G0HB78_9BACT|nr:MAG: Metal dependent phosphohydrolase [Candidatus Nomurabacteria bacterium GW2011_GWB1_37_5]
MKHFKKILEFQKLLKKFNKVYRDVCSLHNRKEPDNDVEHSYRVAMLAWMVAEEYKLKLDINKIIKYALVHDLVEVYAGDVSLYKNNNKRQKNKEIREHQALLKLQKEFPKLRSFWKLIDSYEKRNDEESKFVYIIEKLEPIFLVFLSERDHWKKRNIGITEFVERKQSKIKSIDSFAQKFNKETMEYLRRNHKKFF